MYVNVHKNREKNRGGETLLGKAAGSVKLSFVRKLLDLGADVNKVDANHAKFTPLMHLATKEKFSPKQQHEFNTRQPSAIELREMNEQDELIAKTAKVLLAAGGHLRSSSCLKFRVRGRGSRARSPLKKAARAGRLLFGPLGPAPG